MCWDYAISWPQAGYPLTLPPITLMNRKQRQKKVFLHAQYSITFDDQFFCYAYLLLMILRHHTTTRMSDSGSRGFNDKSTVSVNFVTSKNQAQERDVSLKATQALEK